jgi:hypothetical protein
MVSAARDDVSSTHLYTTSQSDSHIAAAKQPPSKLNRGMFVALSCKLLFSIGPCSKPYSWQQHDKTITLTCLLPPGVQVSSINVCPSSRSLQVMPTAASRLMLNLRPSPSALMVPLRLFLDSLISPYSAPKRTGSFIAQVAGHCSSRSQPPLG